MKAVIVSRKHIVQHTQFTVASATVTTHSDVAAVAQASVNTAPEITEGNVVKAIFIELWLLTNAASIGTFVCIVEKVPGGQVPPNFTNMTTLDAYPNKKNVLFTSQGLLGQNVANPTPVLRQWIKIPKGKQRFGLNDKVRINISAIGSADILGCGMTIFKSYS